MGWHHHHDRPPVTPPPAAVEEVPDVIDVPDWVWADFGNGYILAPICRNAYQNDAGETKYGVQGPDGSYHEMTYREPHDVEESGGQTGMTFKLL